MLLLISCGSCSSSLAAGAAEYLTDKHRGEPRRSRSGPCRLAGMPPVVSIVIPCFITTPRQSELLDETLATVAQQSFSDYEVIVVDDGSPVEVRPGGEHLQRFDVVRQPNGGSAVARNTGIGRSRGEFRSGRPRPHESPAHGEVMLSPSVSS